jgi:putative ATP-binding cassette transporter
MLDEATSALDIKNEERLYRQLSETATTLVSVSHRSTILKYHHQVLELIVDGQWKLHSANDYSFNQ